MKFKKLNKKLYEIIFTIALTLLGNEKEIIEELVDTIKDLVVALLVIPIWYWMSGNLENELYEPVTIISHFLFLIVIVFIVCQLVKLNGKMAYYTHAIIPLLIIGLIKLGISVISAVVFACVFIEIINYMLFMRKKNNNKN